MGRIEIFLEPIRWSVISIPSECFAIFCLCSIELWSRQENRANPPCLRTVWIFHCVTFCVMFSVDTHPFLRDDSRGQPEPKTEKMRSNRMERESPMCLMTMEKYRHRNHRDMRHSECEDDNLPPSSIQEPMREKVKKPVHDEPPKKWC